MTQALLEQQTREGQINTRKETKTPEKLNSNREMCVPSRDLHRHNGHEATNHTLEPRKIETRELDTRIGLDSDELGTMGVPEVREDWPNELWEAIRNAKDGSLTIKSTPLETVFKHPIMV